MLKKINNSEIIKIIKEDFKLINLCLIYTFIGGILSLAPVAYMKEVYGPVINTTSYKLLIYVTIILITFIVISGIMDWVRFKLMQSIASNLDKKISEKIFEISYKSYLYTRSKNSKIALNDLKTVRNFISSPVMLSLLDAPMSILFIIVVYLIHHKMAIALVIAMMLILLINYYIDYKTKSLVMDSQKLNSDAQIFIAENINGAQTIKSMGMLNNIYSRWSKLQFESISKMSQAGVYQSFGAISSKFILITQGSVLIFIGCWLTLMGDLSDAGSSMIIASIIGSKAIQPMVKIITSWKSVTIFEQSLNRLDELILKNQDKSPRMKLPAPVGNITVENLSVKAPGGAKNILNNLNFSLSSGGNLAVMGPSGSGKSTLAKYLVGIFYGSSGSVRLDGVDVYSWNKSDLGPHVGYLSQNVDLFEATIAENICRFGMIDNEEIFKALKMVGLLDLVQSFPEGIHTNIGGDGIILSGGQKQRMGIARAIYSCPKLVVMDEPNSNLDQEGLQYLNEIILTLKLNKITLIIMTHKKDILKNIDNLLIIKEGNLKIYGPKQKVFDKLSGIDVKSISHRDAVKNGFKLGVV